MRGDMSPISSRKIVPPCGPVEACPLLARRRAGERPLLVPEELGLDQLVGDRRAVDLDERPARSRDDARWIARATSSLPVPALAGDQHGRLGRPRARDQLAHAHHRGRVADEQVAVLLVATPRGDLLAQAGALEQGVAMRASTTSRSSGFSRKSCAPRCGAAHRGLDGRRDRRPSGPAGRGGARGSAPAPPARRSPSSGCPAARHRGASGRGPTSASSPLAASRTRYPSYSRIIRSASRMAASSSTTRIAAPGYLEATTVTSSRQARGRRSGPGRRPASARSPGRRPPA